MVRNIFFLHYKYFKHIFSQNFLNHSFHIILNNNTWAQGRSCHWTRGNAPPPPHFFLSVIIIYMCINFSNFVLLNYILFPLNNIIDSFKHNVILTNFFTTFLQNVLVANFFWFTYGPTTHSISLLTSNLLLYQ